MQLLEKVARAGNTVLFTIHQPSSRIFFSFDKLILLNDGQLMYSGATSSMVSDFEDLGFPAEVNFNPADWALVSYHRTLFLVVETDPRFSSVVIIGGCRRKLN